MFLLPDAGHATANERALSQMTRVRITAQTGTTLSLGLTLRAGLEQVFKNGSLLDPGADYTISGATLTLTSAAVSTDVFVVYGHFRG
jgi:hypothetical protein